MRTSFVSQVCYSVFEIYKSILVPQRKRICKRTKRKAYFEEMDTIQTFRLRIERESVQGGLTNEEFGKDDYNDYRFVHRYATKYFIRICPGLEDPKRDSKFHDAVETNTGKKFEGKKLKQGDGVCFAPSVNIGAGRKMDKANIQKCFEMNSYYYLYTTTGLDDKVWELTIRLVPIELIKVWYGKYANASGTITYSNCTKCINSSKQDPVVNYMYSRESGFCKL